MSLHSRDELQRAAADAIGIMKTIHEFRNSKNAVIGGLTVWKYIQRGRTTEEVDFIVNIDSAPHGVKSRLLALDNTPFVQMAQKFFYVSSEGKRIQIDVIHQDSSPYLPEAAVKIKHVAKGEVPYISPIDLIVFKIYSCGMRAQVDKRRLDASDAMRLVLYQEKNYRLKLSREQKKIVEPCIADVVAYGAMPEEWWRAQLGLKARKSREEEYWTWSDKYQRYYHVNEDWTYEWAQEGELSAG